jgi:hypothetical protein
MSIYNLEDYAENIRNIIKLSKNISEQEINILSTSESEIAIEKSSYDNLVKQIDEESTNALMETQKRKNWREHENKVNYENIEDWIIEIKSFLSIHYGIKNQSGLMTIENTYTLEEIRDKITNLLQILEQ